MWQSLSSSGGRLVLGRSHNVGLQFTRAFATGLIATGVDVLTVGLHYMPAKTVATACRFLFNFTSGKLLLFRTA